MRLPGWLTLITLVATERTAHSFRLSPPRQRSPISLMTSFARQETGLYASTDDEIAKLEAQLKQLKDEKESQQQTPLSPELLERAKRTDMILSEQDLLAGGIVRNDSDDSGSSNSVVSIVAGIIGLVAVLLFAQIPVGQDDLARYSPAAGPKNAATATSIDLGDLNPGNN